MFGGWLIWLKKKFGNNFRFPWKPRWFAWVAGQIFVFVLLAISIYSAPSFKISDVKADFELPNPNSFYLNMEKRLIQEILDTAKGKNLLWFHVVWDWSEALNHPAMCDYYTSKVWPNLIRVYLKLCPILFWERKDQQIRPVFSNAREGQWMTAKIDKDGVIVNFWSKLSEEDIYQIRSQLLPIWRSEQEPIKKFVSLINSIEVDSQNQIQVTLSNQIRVLLGDEVSPKKVQRVTRVLNWIKQKNLEMCVIDAQQDEKFLVRLRNHF